MKHSRLSRINELLKQEIATSVAEKLVGHIVTITAVDASPDLREAKVWYSTITARHGSIETDGEVEQSIIALVPEIVTQLRNRLTMKYIPRLTFLRDRGLSSASRIDQLIHDL